MKEKCFKILGYPLGHKNFKGTANIVQADSSTTQSPEQYQQVMTYIQTHMANSSFTKSDKPGILCIGISFSVLDNLSKSFTIVWLVDSGASAHICIDEKLF